MTNKLSSPRTACANDIESVDPQVLESERRLRAVLDAAVDAIITINDRGIIESVNPATERLFGYSTDEMLGRNISMLMPQPYRHDHDRYLQRYLSTGERKIIGIGREVQGQRKDGTIFPMDLAVSEVTLPGRRLFTGMIRDITERKRAEAAIRESERRLSTLISNLPGAVYRCKNDPWRSIEFISSGCVDLCDYSPEELQCQTPSWNSLIDPSDRDRVDQTIREAMERRRTYRVGYRIRHRSGQQRWVWEQGQGVFDASGSAVACEGFITDMTELHQAREQLVQSERLAAMGQMLTGIAHESRNALQRIQAAVDMLGLEIDPESESGEDLARIARARADLQCLFEELRQFAAPIHLARTKCSLVDVWRHAWAQLETARRDRDATLSERLEVADPVLFGDAFRLEQVFRNLMENSLAACADPVRMTVECEAAHLDHHPALRIRVVDNGPGLNADQRSRVFDAFYTTKTKGSGLGMAIARRIIEAHGGRIEACENGPGAVFEILLPRG